MVEKSTTASRLLEIMRIRGLNQTKLLELCQPYCKKYNTKLNKSHLSQYINGKNEPRQDKLTILSLALNVSEAWLMGYNVPMNESKRYYDQDSKNAIFAQLLKYGNDYYNLIRLFDLLNDNAKIKAITYVIDLLENSKNVRSGVYPYQINRIVETWNKYRKF